MIVTHYLDPDLFTAVKKKPTRDAFGLATLAMAEKDERIVVLTADVAGSVRANWFADKFPDRFYDMGISEQNMIAVAAGMSLEGLLPYVSTFGVFITGRCYDQVRVLLAYSETNVKLVATHTGVTVGEDGVTHQMLEDVAMMQTLPKMRVIVPCDTREAIKALTAIKDLPGPFYVRLGRQSAPLVTSEDAPFEFGKALMLQDGEDVTLIANGVLVYEALLAARILAEENISARVLNMHTVKPLDNESLMAAALETGAFVTAEEHQCLGGLGSAVASWSSQQNPVPLEMIGMKDEFGQSGKSDELLDYYHLRAPDIVEAAHRVLKRK
ncbi:MAG: transketolase C-terminal domain-containing protein [Candidatus Marinimicrobia bacterium]|nr:transketolase C-terminal domain-containing protein [Candidatus Neomarinimicrobiota bacterium]MDD5582992.1 transketolase C-terminal domain-containing protein [Candidatus Neomarinimicrobiota bacterium]